MARSCWYACLCNLLGLSRRADTHMTLSCTHVCNIQTCTHATLHNLKILYIFFYIIVLWRFLCLCSLVLTKVTRIKYFIRLPLRFWLNMYALHVKIGLITENLYPWCHEYWDFNNLGQWIDVLFLAEIWSIWLKRFCCRWR